MIRTLTNCPDLEAKIRTLRIDMEWDRAIHFCQDHLLPLESLDLQHLPDPRERFCHPSKWFNFMAKGREFKGSLQMLLAKNHPEVLNAFAEATKLISDNDVIASLLETFHVPNKEEAFACLTMDLPKKSTTDPEGGASRGKETEAAMAAFLSSNRLAPNEATLLQNVVVKGKSVSAPGSFIVSGGDIVEKMTAEFDCLIVEPTLDHKVRIREVWEAKATIHPMTLYDAFIKKGKSIIAIMRDRQSAVVIDGVKHELVSKDSYVLGVFGSSLMPPTAAAELLWSIACQKTVSSDSEAVKESIRSKSLEVPGDKVTHVLNLLELALGSCSGVSRQAFVAAPLDP